MKRTLLSISIAALMFLALHRTASAMVEFCPAHLNYAKAGPGLYGFDLSAASARTVTSTTLLFDTSAAWYSVGVPNVALVEKDRPYTGPSSSFVRRDYVSPVMYVHFPQPLTVKHAWVASASGTRCDPVQRRLRVIKVASSLLPATDYFADDRYHMSPQDEDPLSSPAQKASVVLEAAPASSGISGCGKPFDGALVSQAARGEFPEVQYTKRLVTTVEIATGRKRQISRRGNLGSVGSA